MIGQILKIDFGLIHLVSRMLPELKTKKTFLEKIFSFDKNIDSIRKILKRLKKKSYKKDEEKPS